MGFMWDNPVLIAEGQIIEGSMGSLSNIGCRVNVKVGELKFNDIRIELNLEDPNLKQVMDFEKLNGKVIIITIE